MNGEDDITSSGALATGRLRTTHVVAVRELRPRRWELRSSGAGWWCEHPTRDSAGGWYDDDAHACDRGAEHDGPACRHRIARPLGVVRGTTRMILVRRGADGTVHRHRAVVAPRSIHSLRVRYARDAPARQRELEEQQRRHQRRYATKDARRHGTVPRMSRMQTTAMTTRQRSGSCCKPCRAIPHTGATKGAPVAEVVR
jgi:hypothetical protein